MFRFTIRDLFWLTVVVALGMAWWIERFRHAQTAQKNLELTMQAEQYGRAIGDLMEKLKTPKTVRP